MLNSAGKNAEYNFAVSPQAYIPRTRINRPFRHMTTMNTDYLYPLFWDEVLPGDTFSINANIVAKMSTLLVPIMDNVYLDMQFYFVPYRIVWDNWEKMCGYQENPGDSTAYTVPYLTPPTGGIAGKSIGDYFGLPTGVEWSNHDVMALPFRAYNLIWNEWYRDENLQNSVTVNTGDNAESISNYSLLKRGKRKDYFTGAMPTPQKSLSPVVIPLGGTIPVRGDGNVMGLWNPSREGALYSSGSGTMGTVVGDINPLVPPKQQTASSAVFREGTLGLHPDPTKSGVVADLSNASAVSINALRQAFQLQKLLERDNLGGTRYYELLHAHFGIVSPDSRLQRPEFLGSFTVPLNVNTVAQTSASVSGGTAQGTLAAFGTINRIGQKCVRKSFVEFGCIIGLASIRADLSYQQGIHRAWSRTNRDSFYWPVYSHLGEQAILNKEIYAQNSSVVDSLGNKVNDKAFGYQERWSEYKYGQSRISAELRSTYSTPLDMWHLSQSFASLPTLNSTFIEEAVPLDRALAVTSAVADQFVVDSFFDVNCIRPMPLFDQPGYIDHF